jgi:hypothetical protein
VPFKASASSRPLLLVCSAPGINVIGTLIVSRERSPQFSALGLPGSASRCSVTLTSMPWWNDRDGEAHEKNEARILSRIRHTGDGRDVIERHPDVSERDLPHCSAETHLVLS